ncbi:UNVERIFIED_CONTAM: hypothetical protein PYX00_010442 [Menopon gallinae]|uniref:C2H2-type domain-containing protein n=1 Tax=Menopon gallinae TaxID=328185 RepID=A0AAW2HFR1_9NEOP
MDQIDLSIGVPLLVEDQNETIVYLDSPEAECDSKSVIFENNEALIINDSNETLLIDSDSINEAVLNNNLVKTETLVVNQDFNDETLVLKKENEDVENNKGDKNEGNVYNSVLTDELSEDDAKNENTVLIETVEGSQFYVNGEMVQLLDGNLVVDGSNVNENEDCTPVKLYNGDVIYLVPSTLLSSINSSNNANQCEDVEKVLGTELNTEERTEKSKGFHCNYKNCNKSYTSFHHLKVHLRAHTGDRPFRCSVEGCNKAFSTGFGLKTHFRTHNGERPYTCNHSNCDKGFKTSGDLQKHIRTHTGERPFLCPIPNCGRSFTTCNICKVHVRTHTGERPYKCTYPNCNKTFASVTNQRNHMRIHSGEKPYVCRVEKCGRRFTEYSSLYKHNMVHRQQPHLCLICGKTYRQSSGLMMHMKSAHTKRDESFWMVDKNPSEDISPDDDTTAIFLVDNIALEDEVLEDPLFSDLREAAPLNV